MRRDFVFELGRHLYSKTGKVLYNLVSFGLVHRLALLLLDPVEAGLQVCQPMQVLLIAGPAYHKQQCFGSGWIRIQIAVWIRIQTVKLSKKIHF